MPIAAEERDDDRTKEALRALPQAGARNGMNPPRYGQGKKSR
jgi:hypothetical protein